MASGKRIVIIGAGPTGLGAAHRLHELGYENWELYEKADDVGGHSTSHVDAKGFVWDEGGHVIFSHYPYFDQLVDKMLRKEVHEKCLVGLAKATANGAGKEAANFRDWILAAFGEGIAEAFMFPYNSKVWTTPLERMSKSWIADRVAVVDFKRVLENVLYERDDV